MPEIVSRVIWALAIIALGLLAYWLVNRIILLRVRSKTLGLDSFQLGSPAILYFTTPGCVPCKTVQQPALRELKEWLGNGVQMIEVDADERPDLANYWGVLSVPTTFLIDSSGRPRHVNHGVAHAEKLLKQLENIEGHVLVELKEKPREEMSSAP
ncbi:MAG: thioredoxin family protein [Chloroflexi bacterium]|nr:thioredoxin family protein [Chloroflexota bacterium]